MFSDGSSTPLRDIDPDQFYLTVDTLDSHVIAFAPVLGSKDTRVIAVGAGKGELLKVSLELADDCHDKNDDPLATANVYVEVDFDATAMSPEVKNNRQLYKGRKGRGRKRKENKEHDNGIKTVNMGDLSEMFSNVALRDDNSRADMYPHDTRSPPANVHEPGYHHVTTLEVGMYILLGVFCVAIAVFMASCFVYASKHSEPHNPLQRKSQSVQNAHDWVWLGRQTLDKNSVGTSGTSGSRDLVDNNANSLQSRDSRGLRHFPPHGHQFEATADVNIIQNPGAGPAEYGFVNKRGLKVSNFSPDVYAELPRRRWPRGVNSPVQQHPSQLYQNHHPGLTQVNYDNSRSPLMSHRHQRPPLSSSSSSSSSLERTPPRHNGHLHPQAPASPCASRASSQRSRSSRVNSATYTRRRPVVPEVDILPVGFPVFNSQLSAGETSGFQNPWEALQMYRNQPEMSNNISNSNTDNKLHEFFDEDDDGQTVPLQLRLNLEDQPPEPEPQDLRQSPASALPPYHEDVRETTYVITPEHIKKPRGEYIPLNPDINKPNPPRKGASKIFSDPFNVSDAEAPPVTSELLSPSHVFSSLEDINNQFAEANKQQETSEFESETDNCSVTSAAEDNCSSVCSADSGELEMMEDDLPPPPTDSCNVSPTSSLGRSRRQNDNSEMRGQLDNTDLNSVPLGSLDYEHLMNYFECLKESAA